LNSREKRRKGGRRHHLLSIRGARVVLILPSLKRGEWENEKAKSPATTGAYAQIQQRLAEGKGEKSKKTKGIKKAS